MRCGPHAGFATGLWKRSVSVHTHTYPACASSRWAHADTLRLCQFCQSLAQTIPSPSPAGPQSRKSCLGVRGFEGTLEVFQSNSQPKQEAPDHSRQMAGQDIIIYSITLNGCIWFSSLLSKLPMERARGIARRPFNSAFFVTTSIKKREPTWQYVPSHFLPNQSCESLLQYSLVKESAEMMNSSLKNWVYNQHVTSLQCYKTVALLHKFGRRRLLAVVSSKRDLLEWTWLW